MDLAWIDDLAALEAHLNFSRAAEARNITQPAFSRRIRALEEWVGCSLVERSTHRIRLTQAGTTFLHAAQESMKRLHEAKEEALLHSEEDGVIRFASTNALSLSFFPKWFAEVSSMLASAPMTLVADNMMACERLMLEGSAHFLLCHWHPKTATPLAGTDFETIVLGADNLVLITGRDDAGTPRYEVPGTTPDSVPFLRFDEKSGLGRIIATVAPQIERDLNATTIFRSHMALVLKNLVAEGRGVAWAPLSLVQQDLEPGGSLALANPDISIPIDVVLVRRRGRLNNAAQAFWDRVKAE